MNHELPAALRAALERAAEGVSRGDLARRSASLSAHYRAGGGSDAIRNRLDALAYAMVRMPATFAAVSAALAETVERLPQLSPATMIDAGAGPGTASWAAAACFPDLRDITQYDTSAPLRDLSCELGRADPRLDKAVQVAGDLRSALTSAQSADLVIAAYVLAEAGESSAAAQAITLWNRTQKVLLLVEPGTPAGTARILAARQSLIAAGAQVVAPCPHATACPLQPPEWCHFAQRLPRSRDHKQIKGADVPFEDEKFIYLAVTRLPVESAAGTARVVAPPHTGKAAVSARLCMNDGQAAAVTVARRQREAYARARRWHWGERVPWPIEGPQPE